MWRSTFLFASMLVLISSCRSPEKNANSDAGPSATIFDAGVSDGGVNDAGPVDAGPIDSGVPPTNCLEAAGVCTGSLSACVDGGGIPRSEFASDCVFSDVPGVCCVPPKMTETGETCAEHGGICTPVGGCIRDDIRGHIAPPSCGASLFVCCVPAQACPEPRPICCSSTATFRATCDRGTYTCIDPSWTLRYTDSCP